MSCVPQAMCPAPWQGQPMVIDLRNPIYLDGLLQTEEGGVIQTSDLRIQAKKIHYLNQKDQCTIYGEGNLLIDYQEWVLTGDAFFYDLRTKTGYLLNGKTAAPPWFIGSRRMELRENGDLFVFGGYLTTSEGPSHDVQLLAPRIRLSNRRVVAAKDLMLMVKNVPLFWIPGVKFNVKSLDQSPFSVQFGWGGFMASYISVLYHFLDWNDLNAYARVDGFFQHGIGLGIDTRYHPKHSVTEWYSRNYWVHDLAIDTPVPRNRWRYQGSFSDAPYNRQIKLKACYDFVSDAQMANQYVIQDFDLKTAGRTQLELKRQDPHWIAQFATKVRVNSFQSLNQELPSFHFNWHPIELAQSGILFSGDADASYLHYMFSKDVTPSGGFNAGRLAVNPLIYRPFTYGCWSVTPEIGGKGIYYTDSPSGDAVGQAAFLLGVKCQGRAYGQLGSVTHTVSPYLNYEFFSSPRVSSDRHYLFTIQDGLGKLERFRFGMRNSLFCCDSALLTRPLWIDLWGNLFIKEGVAFPDQKAYLDIEYKPLRTMTFAMTSGWDFTQHVMDRVNPRLDWTLSEHLAVAAEFRYRTKYAWRKADFYNFILENVRTLDQLLDSALSDQRKTFLLRAFWRLHPDLGVTFDLRHGWDRVGQPNYTEYSATLDSILFSHWRFQFVLEKRESDVRYRMSLRLDPPPPKLGKHYPKL